MAEEIDPKPVEPTPAAAAPAPPTPAEAVTASYDLEEATPEPEGTPEVVPARQPEPSVPPAAALPSHPDYLVRMALDQGFSDEQIKGASVEQLQEAVMRTHREVLELARQNSRQSSIQNPPAPVTPPEPGPVQQAQHTAPAPSPPEPDINLGLDESQYDPHLIGALKAQARELARLKAEQKAEREERARERNISIARRADKAFEKHASLLGTGQVHELKPDSREFRVRNIILGMVDADKSHRSLEAKIDAAVETLYPSAAAPEPSEPAALTPNQRRWQEAALARPTHRAGSAEPPGPKKAEKSVAAQMRELGSDNGASGSAAKDDFLD